MVMRTISARICAIIVAVILFGCSTESTPVYQLTMSAEPSEAGAVTPSSGEYEEGEQVEITANPNEHWVFERWQGDHTGNSNPANITINSDKNVTALFIKRDYPLTVNTEGEGTVSEKVIQTKTTDYPHGTTVELTANPADGWEFVEWRGDLVGDINPSNVTVEEEMSITAIFQEAIYDIEISVEGEGNVVVNPIKETYEFGDIVTLTVEPAEGWSFVHWDGSLDGTQNPYEVSMSQDLRLTVVLDENPFAGGNGSMEYPFLVENINQFQEIRLYTSGYFFEQKNDIDASATIDWNNGDGFRPIGDDVIKFEGTYDGKGHIINGLYMKPSVYRWKDGPFAYIINSVIKNVHLKNVHIIGFGDPGGLVGISASSKIINSSVSGFISGNGIGGIVSINERNSVIENSSTDIQIETGGGTTFGGLAGSNGGLIKNSYSQGNITGDNEWGNSTSGGLVGYNFGDIENSYSEMNINVKATSAGGLVAQNNGTLENSYFIGTIKGENEVGGLVGTNYNSGQINNSFSAGFVEGMEDVGAIVGLNGAAINTSYWDIDSASQDNGVGRGSSDGTTGLTTSEIQGSSAKENMPEFDWVEIWKTVQNDYPILRWQDD